MGKFIQKTTSATKKLIGVVAIGFLMIILTVVALFASGMSRSSQPNPGGATTAHAADPTDPTFVDATTKIKIAVDPTKSLQERKAAIQSLETDLTLWQQKVDAWAGTDATKAAKKNSIDTQITSLKTALTRILTSISQTSSGTVTAVPQEDLNKLQQDLNSLSDGIKAVLFSVPQNVQKVIDLANKFVRENNNGHVDSSGKHVHPYVQHDMDCSGFISRIMNDAGVFDDHIFAGQPSTKIGALYNIAQYSSILTIVAGNGTADVDLATLEAAANPLKPGDIIVGRSKRKGSDAGHMYMYIGPTYTAPNNVVESTSNDKAHTSGPQYNNLARIFSWYHNKYILRPINYATP